MWCDINVEHLTLFNMQLLFRIHQLVKEFCYHFVEIEIHCSRKLEKFF